jgi:hypothetical protein
VGALDERMSECCPRLPPVVDLLPAGC